MEYDYYSPSETFVALTADQFVGRDDETTRRQIPRTPSRRRERRQKRI